MDVILKQGSKEELIMRLSDDLDFDEWKKRIYDELMTHRFFHIFL